MNIIKRLRIESDLSQGDFGALFDASASHISRLESGLKTPGRMFLQKLAEHFTLSVEELEAGMRNNGKGTVGIDYKSLYEQSLEDIRQLKLELTELKLKLHFQSAESVAHFQEN